jgi:hypothetical protein
VKPGDKVVPRDSAVNNVQIQVRKACEITHSAREDLRILEIDVPDPWREIDPGRQA